MHKPEQQKKTKISNLQFFIMIIASTAAFGHFVYAHLIILDAGRDAWLALLLGMVGGGVLSFLLLKLFVKRAQLSLVKYNETVFGPWLGSLVSICYILFFLVVIGVTMKVVIDFMSIIYPSTPAGVFLLGVIGIAAWGSYKGVEVLGRAMQISLPVLMLLGILASLLSIKDKDVTQLMPVMYQGFTPVLLGALMVVTMMSELIVFRTISSHVENPAKLPRQTLLMSAILCIMTLGPVTGPIMLFGEELAQSLAFPTFSEIQYIHVGNIIERLDIVGVLLWSVGSFFRVAIFLFAAVKSTSDMLRSKENTFVIPIAVLAGAASMSIMQESRENLYVFLDSIYMYITLAVGLALPALTAGVDFVRGLKKRNTAKSA